MLLKTIVDEDFANYKVPSMYIGTASCGGKCCIEAGIPLSVCQNDEWRSNATLAMADTDIIKRYLSNSITGAICFAGLEPFEQFAELYNFISTLRNDFKCTDTVVVYTGYNENEVQREVSTLSMFDNIVVKFGRYIPDSKPRYDDILGVTLASENQYAKKIS